MIGIFDVFKIGIGPSSSHTMGPMRAGCCFVKSLEKQNILNQVTKINVYLLGSLAHTGKGHSTDQAVLCGLAGEMPDTVNPDNIPKQVAANKKTHKLNLLGKHSIDFNFDKNIIWQFQRTLKEHPNGLEILAYDKNNIVVYNETYISIGGGFISTLKDFNAKSAKPKTIAFYDYNNANDLLVLGEKHNLSISQIAIQNEIHRYKDVELVNDKIDRIWQVMHSCIQRGINATGNLPTSGLARRANKLHKAIHCNSSTHNDIFEIMDWVSLFAVAVNEENAAGGKIVTAPTNGAAGVVPAVLGYYDKFLASKSKQQGIRNFIATAAAIGVIIIKNASISGAEAGCQAEVGSACAMAAAGLTATQGGSNQQIENAAEIALEHNLGMTCDPVGGLVQIPCIERNAMAAVKAVNASRMALKSDGTHAVPLDSCIKTMYETGIDLQEKYRETSLGGLAINLKVPSKK
jgi:L-serine dehydratase